MNLHAAKIMNGAIVVPVRKKVKSSWHGQKMLSVPKMGISQMKCNTYNDINWISIILTDILIRS